MDRTLEIERNRIVSQNGQWILLVEDDPEVALLLGDGMREAGFRVIFAHSVLEAVAKLERQRFDGVVLDIHLTHGTGEQVIEHMRNIKGLNDQTPILVVSAMLDEPLVKRIRGEVHGILVKPFNLSTLVQRVAAMLSAQPGARGIKEEK